MITKALSGVELKERDDKIEVEAVFAQFDVKDHDDDVTVKGAFGEQLVRISDWNHSSWGAARPVGKGRIREEGNEAIFRGEFFKTQAAQDVRETLKGLGELAEWCFGFDVEEHSPGEKDGEKVRVLKKLKVHEVSPVLLGAGIGTGTRFVKSAETLDDEIRNAVEAVERAVERATRVEALRAEKGLELTDAVRKSLEGLNAAQAKLSAILSKNSEDHSGELANLALKFASLTMEG